MKTKEEFIKSENLHKEYTDKTEELNKKCYVGESLLCGLNYFIKELQEKRNLIESKPNVKDITFEQFWTGYEYCDFCISYKQLETDAEYIARINKMYLTYVEVYKNKEREKDKQRTEEKYREELRALKDKYNKT